MTTSMSHILLNSVICLIFFILYLWLKKRIREKAARKIIHLPFGPRAVRITDASRDIIKREFGEKEINFEGAYLVYDWFGTPPRRCRNILYPQDFHAAYEFIYAEEPDHFGEIRKKYPTRTN